jgi:hypothetical protein
MRHWICKVVAATLLLLCTAPTFAQGYLGIGTVETIDGLEVVVGTIDTGESESVSLLFYDEFGLLEAASIAVDQQGNFVALTSNLWIATASSCLSAVLVDEANGDIVGNVAIVAIGRPVPSAPMDAESVNGIIDALPPGNSAGVHVVGSESELDDLFVEITAGGTEVIGTSYPGILVQLPDGTIIGIRPDSTSGGGGDTTIDIKYPDGSKDKVHIDPCSPGN